MKSSASHIVIACIICAMVFLVHGFLYTVIAKKSTTAAELQNQIDLKREKIKNIASSRAALSGIAKEESVVNKYFVSESEVVSFIADLQASGLSQGAVVKVLSVSTGNANMRPSLTLSLTIAGAFDAVMKTVGMIEYSPYYLTISKFSISKDDKKTWKSDIEIVAGSIQAEP
jgi:Tfp pilus assembly protein PilO